MPEDVKRGVFGHTLPVVYGHMLVQIAMDFPGITARARDLKLSEIRFWYEGIREALKKRTQ